MSKLVFIVAILMLSRPCIASDPLGGKELATGTLIIGGLVIALVYGAKSLSKDKTSTVGNNQTSFQTKDVRWNLAPLISAYGKEDKNLGVKVSVLF